MGRTEPITFKVEPGVANQLEDEAEEEGKSKSQYIRDVVSNRHQTDEAIDRLLDKVRKHQGQIRDLEAELESKRDEVTALQEKLVETQETLRSRNARLNNLREVKESLRRIESLLEEDVDKNGRLLAEMVQDVDAIEGEMHTLRKRQGVFIDEARDLFEDLRDQIHMHTLNAEDGRAFMQKVWEEFRRYHKQDFRARSLRKLGLVPSRHDLPEEEPELSDNPAEEH